MIVSIAGYMGSGKSHVSRLLAQKTGFIFKDLDKEIVLKNQASVADIFTNKGEIYFRKQEREALEKVLASPNDTVLSLGGGTPAYYDNIEIINDKSTSIFLRASVATLAERLQLQKQKRPLIAGLSDGDLPEYIAKHLFERNPFYNRCRYTVDTDGKSPEAVAEEIIPLLGF